MSKKLIRLLTAVITTVAAAALGYLAYLAVTVNQKTVQTVRMQAVTADVGFYADGLIFRDESLVLKNRGAPCVLLARDGEKIGDGETVAVCFRSSAARDAYVELNAVKARLALLQQVKEAETGGNELAAVNGEIAALSRGLVSVNGQGGLRSGAEESGLLAALVLRDRCLGSEETVNAAVAALEERARSLEAAAAVASGVTADGAGYFSGRADGWEQVVDLEKLLSCSYEDYEQMLASGALTPDADRVAGKLIRGYTWYFAYITDRAGAEAAEPGKVLTVDVGGGRYEMTAARRVYAADGQRALILLSCDIPLADVSVARDQRASVVTASYEGFRVPAEGLRVEDGVSGVYVLEGVRAVFKPVEILLNGEGYYLVRASDSDRGALFTNDEVIVSGTDLADGKVVR